jgi:two-component system OmpR family response regulator
MTERTHLLLVDDDADLREQIAGYLRGHGFEVHLAGDGKEMEAVLARQTVDLIVLDLAMPGEDGLSICRRLSDTGGPPVIMASASGEELDRVLGLELGADDYLPKPFGPRELLARVKAVLRRQAAQPSRRTEGRRTTPTATGWRFEGFRFEPARQMLRTPAETAVLLTRGEAALLTAFLSRPGQVLTREQLAAALGAEGADEGRAIDLHISRLRRKLATPSGAELILTHRGLGYQFEGQVSRG